MDREVTDPRERSLHLEGGHLAVAEEGDPAGRVVLAVRGMHGRHIAAAAAAPAEA